MERRLVAVAAGTWLLAGLAPSAGSEAIPRDVPAPIYRAETELVALAVTVTNERSQHVPDLTADDFVVLENGVPQPLSYFAATDVPLDLTLLVDVSASMAGRLDQARQAVRGLIGALRPDDRVAVFELRHRLTRVTEMTSDRGVVKRALGAMRPDGMTALYTSLYVSLSELAGASPPEGEMRRQALVLLSDGEDTASSLSSDDVLDKARRSGVTIYVVALRPPKMVLSVPRLVGTLSQHETDFTLQRMARDTGGQAFFPLEPSELGPAYRVIAEELRHQYTLAYTPTNPGGDGEWRALRVNVPTYPNVRSRTRAGYFADRGALATASPDWWRGILRR